MVSKLDKTIFGTFALGTALSLGGFATNFYYDSKLAELNDSQMSLNRPIIDPFHYRDKINNSEKVVYAGIGFYLVSSVLSFASFAVRKR